MEQKNAGGARRVPSDEPERELRRRSFYLRYAGLGLEFAGGLAGFVLLGWAIDSWLSSRPIGLIAGALLGFAGGMYNLIRRAYEIQAAVARMDREDAADKKRDDGESP